MKVTPVSMFCDPDVSGEAFHGLRLFDGDGQGHNSVCSHNGAAVAVGLLDIIVGSFDVYAVVFEQLGIIFYRCQIG
jgi:hypothetical protein